MIVVRPLVAEVIEQEERVGLGRITESERPACSLTRTFDRWLSLHDPLHRTNGHA